MFRAGEVFAVKPDNQSNSSPKLLPRPTSKLDNSHQQHFFGCEAFLTVSAQLHLEALSASLGRVYSFGPTSRAEKSQTNCYLAKLWMLKAELLLIEDLESPMNGLESLLKPIIWNLHQSNSLSSQDLKSLGVPKQTYDSTGTSWP
ncbi:hypothetical protein Pst134EA_019710 [Puccinia striiformis f. sp. tritici]|uniref:hypothetical protein n=1 Tax=Puccinia striiformis f. sp. tritici TaxID=168172 RepID=UPI002008D929|nr:hypothetical protein Pst134EA_019710 [Puccinia striiformis f. sp. tritici]KAH9459565.1 hypothetical protein Pst134EA_019710 [Puccinia striiformis f. sp. tritici]KAI9619003.1 hypothetical protein KEM48_006474 [Puccinia striiformis f. sp. tritici PST-130]